MADQPDLFPPQEAPPRADAGVRSRRREPSPPAEEPAPGAGPGTETPLAARLRPRRLEDVVGQDEVVSVLGKLVAAGHLPSMVLWGPPGSGKTTLARILARSVSAHFESLSAVTAGVADLRRVVAEARQRRQLGRPTILFIDEIHRFNKAQQDAVLPHVEDGTVTLIGATTENPSFEVISALLSRSRVFKLGPLTAADLRSIVERGLREVESTITDDAMERLLAAAQGDARRALGAVEVASTLAGGAGSVITVAQVAEALQSPHLLHDRAGDQHYDIVSALIKSIRGSDPDAAVYWLARMLEAGEPVNFVARRLVILASEDVGLADPTALGVAVAAQQAAHLVGMPEAIHPLTQAALHLARAPKSDTVKRAYAAASEAIREVGDLPVPLHLRNAPTGLMRRMGYGEGYRYAHDYEGGVVEQQHLPDRLVGRHFVEPTERDR
ncbi:MAG: replication-associated recombination protein A [Candidatus Dormibacteraeota bacterium]|nr:replication-associated recombination protein A [Candidatus Dormibacteraeota bacterium]